MVKKIPSCPFSLYQQEFVDWVLREDEEKGMKESALLSQIIPAGTLDTFAALKVYRQDYFARMTEALGEVYPAVWRVLGDEHFWDICQQYIQLYPSVSYSLSHYGDLFSCFIRKVPLVEEFPFLPALASFEWEFMNLFHHKQHQSMDPLAISAMDNLEEKIFKFAPAVKIFEWESAIKDIWLLKDSPELPEDFDWNKSQQVVFFKKDDEIRFKELEKEDYFLFTQLLSGKSLNEALNLTSSRFPDITEERVREFFFFLVQSGMIIG